MAATRAENTAASRPRWLLPAGLVVVFVAALAGVVLFARDAAEPDAPPAPGAFTVPPGPSWVSYDVERAEGGSLRLVTGSGQQSNALDLAIGPDTPAWILEPASLAELRTPLVVNVIGIPNEVRNFTIRLLAFAPGTGGEDLAGEFVPLRGGFAGHEVSEDARERPVVSGVVERFSGNTGYVRTQAGTLTIELGDGAPVRLLREARASDIRAGDRVALFLGPDGRPDLSLGVLVLPGPG